MSPARVQNKEKQKKRSFWRVFLTTLAIAVVGGTIGLTLLNNLLDEQIFVKEGSWFSFGDSLPLTAEDIQIRVRGEGMFADEFADSKRVNVLLLGNTDEELSDTIMLVSFDPETKSCAVISVPRDTYYYREGYSASYLKINAVFHDGPDATAKAVHEVLAGIPINYVAVCNYEGVANIVDAMDGVPFDVPMDMQYVSVEQDLYIDLKAGEQTLDGDHAVQYLRFRSGYTNGDIGRVEAQQAFVKAAIKRGLALGKISATAKAVIKNVDSDITLRALLYMGEEAKGMSMDNVQTYILPGESGMIDSLSFWKPYDQSVIEEMLRQIYDPSPAAEETEEIAEE